MVVGNGGGYGGVGMGTVPSGNAEEQNDYPPPENQKDYWYNL